MSKELDIVNVRDYEIPAEMEVQLKNLLRVCFPDFFDGEHSYYKQRLHCRFLALEEEVLVGQLAIDCRVINVGGTVLEIFGVNNLCVLPERRGAGVASALLSAAGTVAADSSQDFMVLTAELHEFYQRHGFERVQPANLKWLAVEDRESIVILEEDLSDCFMVKQLGVTPWPSGQIDMLGYLF